MISVKVVQLNGNRLAKIRRELRYLTSDAFFKTIPLSSFEDDVVKKLRDLSPKGRSKYRRYLAGLGIVPDSGDRTFRDGWRVKRGTKGTKIEFTIWNLLETIGGKRGEAKFRSIEFGSKTTQWVAKRMFRFKSKGEWVTIAAGRSMTHSGNDGAEVQKRTAEYIENVLLPKIGAHVNKLVEQRLSRV